MDWRQVLEWDELQLESVEKAVVERDSMWTLDREFLASLLELVHAHYCLTARANGAKRVPDPLKVPRPNDSRGRSKTPTIPLSELKTFMEAT